MTTYHKICLNLKCQKEFNTNHRHPNQKYCSYECSHISKTGTSIRKKYLIHNCLTCNLEIDGSKPKFCSRSCAAKFNNKGIRRRGPLPGQNLNKREINKREINSNKCKMCENLTSSSKQIYCSKQCSGKSRIKFISLHERRRRNADAQSKYRMKKYRTVTTDADPIKIREIYLNCPIGYEVDHIIPLSKGGKHHENNLQYLTIAENRKKGNKIISYGRGSRT